MNWLIIATRMSRDLINDAINKKNVLVHKNLMRAGLRNNEFYLCGLMGSHSLGRSVWTGFERPDYELSEYPLAIKLLEPSK